MKVFVTSEKTATITCPECGKSRSLQTEKFLARKHVIKIRCSCTHSFAVMLDFRRHYRKETDLEGTYTLLPPAFGAGKITIQNISKSGIGFTVGSSSSFRPGQRARIIFLLDNKKRTRIEKLVEIKTVDDRYVGGEFDLTGGFEKDLGFYLRP